MTGFDRKGVLLAAVGMAVVCAWVGVGLAQIPDKFTNLKVLPKDIGKRELIDVMRGFTDALGQRCSYCHVNNGTTFQDFDFASDEKEHKDVARVMMKMTHEINGTFLPQTHLENPVEVRCVTCHHGVNEPETLDRVFLKAFDKDGLDAATAKYKELRETYYGSAAYDFSSESLDQAAQVLAQERNDLDDAIAVAKLNLEFNPKAARTHLFLGQLYAAKGDKASAVASIQKALELDPGNEHAKELLDKVQSAN